MTDIPPAAEDDVEVTVKTVGKGGGVGLTNIYYLALTGDFVTITTNAHEYLHIDSSRTVILAQYARTGK